MDQEQKDYYKEEFAKLDHLRLQHERISAKVDFVEAELREHKTFVSKSIHDLNQKVDKLNDKFDAVSDEVRMLAMKVAYGAVAVGFVGQIVLKHFGLI